MEEEIVAALAVVEAAPSMRRELTSMVINVRSVMPKMRERESETRRERDGMRVR